jgi:hypothetical protein
MSVHSSGNSTDSTKSHDGHSIGVQSGSFDSTPLGDQSTDGYSVRREHLRQRPPAFHRPGAFASTESIPVESDYEKKGYTSQDVLRSDLSNGRKDPPVDSLPFGHISIDTSLRRKNRFPNDHPNPIPATADGETLIKVHSFDSMPFGDVSVDGSLRRENLQRRPKEFRRAVDIEAQTSSPGADNACDGQSHDTDTDYYLPSNNSSSLENRLGPYDDSDYNSLYDDDSEVEFESLNDEHRQDDYYSTKKTSGDRVTRTRSAQSTEQTAQPSSHSSLRSYGDNISSVQSKKLSSDRSFSPGKRKAASKHSIEQKSPEKGDQRSREEVSSTGPFVPPSTQQPQEASEVLPKHYSRECWAWDDGWLRHVLQWLYVLAVLYIGPACFAVYAPLAWVSYFVTTAIVFITIVNCWIIFGTVCSISYTRRMRTLHHVTRPKLMGERRLGSIVCAYPPNELSMLVKTARAISSNIHELPEGTTLDIVLSHGGDAKRQRVALLKDLQKVEVELPPNVMIHELNVYHSTSKAEHVNAALGFLLELGKVRGKPFTQLSMYDADHRPIPQAWRYALETMEVRF